MPVPALPASTLSHLLPYGLPLLFSWIVWRRIRRNFGWQAWRPTRTMIRLALLVLIAALLTFSAIVLPTMRQPFAIGASCGLGVGLLALRHTHVGWRSGERGYTPNPWIGSALSLLLVGRLLWRWTHAGALYEKTPSGLTLGLAATLIIYSLVYTIGLIRQMRTLPPDNGNTITDLQP